MEKKEELKNKELEEGDHREESDRARCKRSGDKRRREKH